MQVKRKHSPLSRKCLSSASTVLHTFHISDGLGSQIELKYLQMRDSRFQITIFLYVKVTVAICEILWQKT